MRLFGGSNMGHFCLLRCFPFGLRNTFLGLLLQIFIQIPDMTLFKGISHEHCSSIIISNCNILAVKSRDVSDLAIFINNKFSNKNIH